MPSVAHWSTDAGTPGDWALLSHRLRGLSTTGDDERTLAVSGPVFDGLDEHHRRRLLLGRERPDHRRRS